jgi:hypothetical protein
VMPFARYHFPRCRTAGKKKGTDLFVVREL